MRSALFSQFDTQAEQNKAFIKDLQVVMKVSPDTLNKTIHFLPELVIVRTEVGMRQIMNQISEQTGLPHIIIESINNLSLFFTRQLENPDIESDTPNLWVNDLIELRLVTPEEQENFVQFATQVKEFIGPEVLKLSRELQTETGLVPSLKSAGTTVEMRAIQNPKYHWGEPLSEYTPSIIGITPVISIKLGFTRGFPGEIVFQAAIKELDLLIEILQAASQDAAELQKRISF